MGLLFRGRPYLQFFPQYSFVIVCITFAPFMDLTDSDSIENAVIIVTASAPPIRPLFKKRNQNSQSRTSQYTPMTQPQRRVDLTEAGLVEPELQDIGGFSKASQSDHPSIETQSTSRI